MFNKFLGLLAWTGLWQPELVVLNGGTTTTTTTTTRVDLNTTDMVTTTSIFMQGLVDHFVSGDGQKVSYEALEQSTFYSQTLGEFGVLLQSTDPRQMTQPQRKAFFINLYNILTVHAILSRDPLPESTISVPNFWQRYAYKVGPFTLHLDHMEHGILRGNRAHPTTGTVMFPSGDPRSSLTLPLDTRIHGALNCGALSCPPLRSYSAASDTLEEELDGSLSVFCNKGVKVAGDGSLLVNSIFKWFRVDFASTEQQALRWLSGCVNNASLSQKLLDASLGKRSVSYEYDWTLNAMWVEKLEIPEVTSRGMKQ
ncbi:hypothetical protein Pmani_002671 [Petrolisthes manimaculis]|uniref:DUF547 domain-containing protein n=1 Tax=Petrolisthes manimaculis TaxID=1843537 RepID=A0AAE1UQ80_9EUCA|nr:hypothetical protein Pmani_002671 [Petrolisthes manimaculis]